MGAVARRLWSVTCLLQLFCMYSKILRRDAIGIYHP
jgi:hypothetical protein